MHRSFHLVVGALATLTAIALLGTALAVQPVEQPGNGDSPRDAANRALAYAFYEAANTVIATGDPAPLATVLSQDFSERSARAEAATGRDRLIGRLQTIHAVNPALRLAVDAVAADKDLAIVSVRVDGALHPTFLGVRLDDDPTAWGPVDVFRIEHGQIVEHRGSEAATAPLLPLLQVDLDLPLPNAWATIAAAQIVLAPGARHVAPGRYGPRVIVAESDAIAIEQGGPLTTGTTRPTPLAAGKHLVVPPSVDVIAWNTGQVPAAFLDIVLTAPPRSDVNEATSEVIPEDSVDREILADDLLVTMPARPVLAISRATIGPGERFGWTAMTGPVLLHVIEGTVDLRANGSVPWVGARAERTVDLKPAGSTTWSGVVAERSATRVASTLFTGDGALLEAGAVAEIQAVPDAPATVLLVTLFSRDDPSLLTPPVDTP